MGAEEQTQDAMLDRFLEVMGWRIGFNRVTLVRVERGGGDMATLTAGEWTRPIVGELASALYRFACTSEDRVVRRIGRRVLIADVAGGSRDYSFAMAWIDTQLLR